jgi:hypothetical protein
VSGAILHGGPASGLEFSGLNRLPTFVRVVVSDARRFDILNDLEDVPADNESVCAVYLQDPDTRVFVRAPRGAGGQWITYVHVPMAGVEQLRTDDAWIERLAAVSNMPAEIIRESRAREREGT